MPEPRHDAPIPHKGDTFLKGNKFANLFISRNELFQALGVVPLLSAI